MISFYSERVTFFLSSLLYCAFEMKNSVPVRELTFKELSMRAASELVGERERRPQTAADQGGEGDGAEQC